MTSPITQIDAMTRKRLRACGTRVTGQAPWRSAGSGWRGDSPLTCMPAVTGELVLGSLS
jgi:hypothetical protein